MIVEIRIDNSCKDEQIIILASKPDYRLEKAKQIIEAEYSKKSDKIVAYRDEKIFLVDKNDIYKIYSFDNKVVLETEKEEFYLKERLFKLEESLEREGFIRISKSEIVNISKIENFDLSFSGTICVNLKNKTQSYVSRRYIKKIKERLGI